VSASQEIYFGCSHAALQESFEKLDRKTQISERNNINFTIQPTVLITNQDLTTLTFNQSKIKFWPAIHTEKLIIHYSKCDPNFQFLL
jgi:hypothetical protein